MRGFHLLHLTRKESITLDTARTERLVDYRSIILRGLKRVRCLRNHSRNHTHTVVQGYKAFRVERGDDSRIVIPRAYADEIKNNPKLNFPERLSK